MSEVKNKLFWIILALSIVALISIFALTNNSTSNGQASSSSADLSVSSQDHILGPTDAKVTLVEYGDLQCPACATINPHIERLAQEYKADLRIVFRHFPLGSIHANAFSAARASEAAASQDKFWEMVNLLYERQDEWSADTNAIAKFRQYAQELGLNLEQFNNDYNSQAATSRINRDVGLGNQLEVDSTPTFYLNENKISTPRGYQELKDLIEAELTN